MKFLWIILLLPLGAFAQQPSYYTIGERELEGQHIYDIYQAKSGDYWIATNSGLFKFDGYTFEQQKCAEILTSSLFDLTEDANGNIYCLNLAGQIFKVSNGLCKPFFTLPDSLLSSQIDIEIGNQNQLVIMSSEVLVVDSAGVAILLPEAGIPGSSYLGTLTKMPDGSVWSSPTPSGKLIAWKDGKHTVKQFVTVSEKQFDPYHVISFGQDILFNSAGTTDLYKLQDGKALPVEVKNWSKSDERTRVYKSGTELWFVGGTTGAYRVNRNLECIDQNGPVFPNTFISAIFQDNEKNTLLGTFGNGILVIPDGSATDLTGLPKDEKVVSITSDKQATLYFGTQNGNIYSKKQATIKLLHQSTKRTIENLFYLEDESLLFADVEGVKLDLEFNSTETILLGSLKDVYLRNNGEYLLASNHGGAILSADHSKSMPLDGPHLRLHGIGEDANTGTIFACSSKGLMQLKDGNAVFTKMKGESVIARDVCTDMNRVYVATDATGIVVFEQDSIIQNWDVKDGLISSRVRQVEFIDGRLFVATNLGVQILTADGNVLKTITRSEGLYGENIKHFEVIDNVLWVVHNHGVQSIPLHENISHKIQTTLELAKVEVNDSIVSQVKSGQFKYHQNSFRFSLRSRTLRHQNETKYSFKLDGADADWQSATYHQNEIEYRSLAPGKYVFNAKAICSGVESELVQYAFTIATPFYMAWWFYALVSIGLILILLFWFRSRLKRQTFLAEQQSELNASKLTAIQSQMNPHFIFNALNSIQDLVLKGDVTNSYTYITKFADLVRRTLNYSDKDFIDFENELKLIELYLTLEKLRFKTDFEFHIDAKGVEDIQLPPMLVQPFIENALVHGLLHREGSKKLDLKFELKENLVCTITDNGVGRQKAREIKERQRSGHESFSVNAIKKRFEILQRNFGGELGFTTEDLRENGIAVGTRVKLVIPVKRKY